MIFIASSFFLYYMHYPQGLGHTFFFTLYDLPAKYLQAKWAKIWMKPILLVFKFEESINTNTHKSRLHKIYFRFLVPSVSKLVEETKKSTKFQELFLPCRVVWYYYIYNAPRSHRSAYGLILRKTFLIK